MLAPVTGSASRPSFSPGARNVERDTVARVEVLDAIRGTGGGADQIGAVAGAQARRHRVVGPDDRSRPRRQETVEGVDEVVEVAVVVEMVGLDVGHHRDLRIELQERAVALVGLDDDPLAGVPHRVGADLVDVTPDEKARVQPGFDQDQGQHRGGRGLAVGPGHGDAATARGDGGQGLGPAEHHQAPSAALDDLGVCVGDGGGHRHHLGVDHMGGVVAHEDPDPGGSQPIEGG